MTKMYSKAEMASYTVLTVTVIAAAKNSNDATMKAEARDRL